MFISKKQRAQMRKRKNRAKKTTKNTNSEQDANNDEVEEESSSSLPTMTAAEDNNDDDIVDPATKKRRLNEETTEDSNSSNSNIMVIKIPEDLTGKQAKKFRKEARREAKKTNPDIEITFISHDNKQDHESPSTTTITTNPPNNTDNNNDHQQQHPPPKRKPPPTFPRINDILHTHHLQKKLSSLTTHLTTTLPPHQQSLYVAIDCEMVGVGPSGRQSALARISLTSLDGSIILDSHVQVTERVVDYRTWVSGIRAKDVHPRKNPDAMEFDACRKKVAGLLKGKVLVGHSLENDLKALMLNHPKESVRDTARYKPFMRSVTSHRTNKVKLRPRKLRDLAKEFLGMEIQVEGKPHDSVEDARAVMELYKRVRFQWEREIEKNKKKKGKSGKS